MQHPVDHASSSGLLRAGPVSKDVLCECLRVQHRRNGPRGILLDAPGELSSKWCCVASEHLRLGGILQL